MSWHAYAHTQCIKVRTLKVIFGRQMGATKEPLTRQNTLPNTTHTYTQEEGKHRAISNLKSWNWILQRRRRPFLTDQCPMEDMRTNEPDGMPY